MTCLKITSHPNGTTVTNTSRSICVPLKLRIDLGGNRKIEPRKVQGLCPHHIVFEEFDLLVLFTTWIGLLATGVRYCIS